MGPPHPVYPLPRSAGAGRLLVLALKGPAVHRLARQPALLVEGQAEIEVRVGVHGVHGQRAPQQLFGLCRAPELDELVAGG